MEKFVKTKETICSLCFNVVGGSNFLEVKDDVKAVLDVLQLKLIKDENNKLVICNTCSTKLFSAFNFKAVCMDTEDCIFPYVNSANATLVDLRDVYLGKRDKEHLKDLLEDEKICRLCMQVITCSFTSVKDMDSEMLTRYIPEINFNSTKEPVICKLCFDVFNTHANFLMSCFNVGKAFKTIYKDKIIEAFVKPENVEVEIKRDEHKDILVNITAEEYFDKSHNNLNNTKSTNPTPNNTKIDSKRKYRSPANQTQTKKRKHNIQRSKTITKDHTKSPKEHTDRSNSKIEHKQNVTRLTSGETKEKNPPSDTPQPKKHVCKICGHKSKDTQAFRLHQVKHGNCPDLPTLECKQCDYKTQRRNNFERHVLTHKGFKEGRVFKCEKCGLQTRSKQNLQRHQLTHVDLSKTPTYKCGICGMETIHKYNFKKHQATHKDRSIVRTFKCEECEFETIHKFSMDNHVLRHKNSAELETYKCHLCDYVTVSKACLASHRFNHKAAASYECEKCGYKTKNKGHLARHFLTHMKKSEKPLYRCDECGFSTLNQDSLRLHQNRHRDVSQGIKHKCDKCGFETSYREALRRHRKTQKCLKMAAANT